MKILFLSRWYPWPANNGSKIRISNLIQSLSKEFSIDLISFSDDHVSENYINKAHEFCNRVEAVPYTTNKTRGLKALLGFASPYPRSTVFTSNPKLFAKIDHFLISNDYDIVIASEVDMIPYARAISGDKGRFRILEDIEIARLSEINDQDISPINRSRKKLMWKKWQNYLTKNLKDFDALTLVSQQELEIFKQALPKVNLPIFIIPNGVDNSSYHGTYPDTEENLLIYPGALTYSANYDAVEYFLDSIMPLIVDRRPQVKLTVTGSTNGVDLKKLPPSTHIQFTGYVDDIQSLIARSSVCIVPLRHGSGTRLKILESMALGTPVVSTPKGAEGLDFVAGKDLLIAKNSDEFSDSVLRLLSDKELHKQLSIRGRQAVKKYDWSIIGNHLISAVESITQ